ncbi:8-oxo-dGTP diphosphatase MutT [Congregibacter variabilis]|uniref:8-oxo-dGTP diphosphatase n=1 Tax=Congregibacter variabilis TaxID=3081200 RepID=A0ABZ0I870_9GAMM|nr:8-oxo-dGTP diphosphatase MutT [Congregibacter sp. IMCC43200]
MLAKNPDENCEVAPVVHVAVAVIFNADQQILLTKRHASSHQGGLWEFPGGKLEAGERLGDALKRELQEELGIDVLSHHSLLRVEHDYGDKQVLLDVHSVTGFTGQPRAREGQPMRWVSVTELVDYDFPKANVAIVNVLLDGKR